MSCFKGGGAMNTDRLAGILSYLLQKGQATAPELAEQFAVSRRTILRDAEALTRAGIPIRTSQGVRGGLSLAEYGPLGRAATADPDFEAILAGLRSRDDADGAGRYRQLMERCSSAPSPFLPADGRMLIDLGPRQKEGQREKIENIRFAMDRRRLLSFRYTDAQGESDRQIEPYYLVLRRDGWYVWGFCRALPGFRLFSLQGMTALAEGEAFSPREAPLPDGREEEAFPENERVKIKIAAKYRRRLAEAYGEQACGTTADGDCLLSRGFADRDQALTWVLSFQGRAEVLEPASLREEMRKIGKKIIRKHKT